MLRYTYLSRRYALLEFLMVITKLQYTFGILTCSMTAIYVINYALVHTVVINFQIIRY